MLLWSALLKIHNKTNKCTDITITFLCATWRNSNMFLSVFFVSRKLLKINKVNVKQSH